jgi:hypothetical protein
MPELSIDAIGVARWEDAEYLPVTAVRNGAGYLLPLARLVTAATGIPAAELRMLAPGDGPDVTGQALAALGEPPRAQPLFLVRSGPLRDPGVAELARMVEQSGWQGEDIGITHLDELGGTAVFSLLEWAVPEETGATVLICDEPPYTDARSGAATCAAVGLRLRHGPGPLRVLASGEGWLELAALLAAGEIGTQERLLLHTRGPCREGWLALEATDPAALRLTGAALPVAVGGGAA